MEAWFPTGRYLVCCPLFETFGWKGRIGGVLVNNIFIEGDNMFVEFCVSGGAFVRFGEKALFLFEDGIVKKKVKDPYLRKSFLFISRNSIFSTRMVKTEPYKLREGAVILVPEIDSVPSKWQKAEIRKRERFKASVKILKSEEEDEYPGYEFDYYDDDDDDDNFHHNWHIFTYSDGFFVDEDLNSVSVNDNSIFSVENHWTFLDFPSFEVVLNSESMSKSFSSFLNKYS